MKYKRVLLKLSGEALKNNKSEIIDFEYVKEICLKIKRIKEKGYQFGIVIGGGNIWRGRNGACIDIESADTIGLIGTTINAVAVHSVFKSVNCNSTIINAFEIENLVTKNKIDILNELNDNIIVFGGGTGKGGCSTDTASALRAIEMKADAIVKITNVDGVYDKDPNKYDDATKYDKLSFSEVLDKKLNVMDLGSIEICKNNNIPIIVMNINKLDSLDKVLDGSIIGTLVDNDK